MDTTRYTVRRANLDDLPVLKGLWEIARLPVLDLEKHLTEFQLVVRPDGVVAGSFALRVAGQHGLLHSEAYYSVNQAEELRPFIWERLRTLARNQGLARLWLQGEPGAYWGGTGFRPATDKEVNRLPAAFAGGRAAWTTLALHDESRFSDRVEKELELLHLKEQASTERLRRQALILKWIAGGIAIGFFVGAAWLLVHVLGRTRSGPLLP